jgi:hypothetical protein
VSATPVSPAAPPGASPINIDRLPSLPVAELRRLWAEHMGRAAPPVQKCLLVRELAWRIQERAHGGLDSGTRRLLNAAARIAGAAPGDHDGRADPVAGGPVARIPRRPRATAPAAQRRLVALPPASRLVRVWQGRSHEVYVLNSGNEFRYQDRTYRSLSEIAREITGTRWSGPRFFGLAQRCAAEGSK